MKRKRILIAIISAFFILGLSGCGLITKTPEAEQKTAVATVNGEDITKADFQKRLDPLLQQYEAYYGSDYFTKNPSELTTVKDNLLQQMVQEKVMLQKAKELKLTVDDKTVTDEVNKQINAAIKQMGSEKKYEDQLKAAKLTPESYKATLTDEMRTNLTIQKLYNNVTSGANVTDQEVINYYYANQYNYTEKPNTMNVSHILVKTMADAQKVEKLLKGGMKFEDAAKKYSTDPGSAKNGGLIGDVEYTSTEYVKEFVNGAIATPTGKYSNPVQSQYGYHIIKVNSRHVYKQKPLDAVKGEIKTTLLDQKKQSLFSTAYAKWEKDAKISQHTDLL